MLKGSSRKKRGKKQKVMSRRVNAKSFQKLLVSSDFTFCPANPTTGLVDRRMFNLLGNRAGTYPAENLGGPKNKSILIRQSLFFLSQNYMLSLSCAFSSQSFNIQYYIKFEIYKKFHVTTTNHLKQQFSFFGSL